MNRTLGQFSPRLASLWLLAPLALLALLTGCTAGHRIVFVYPDEELDFRLRNLKTPTLFIDMVSDLRPVEQREGQGHFFGITYPKDEAWARPATQIYAEALAQDVEQTHLFELVPLRGQADYVLSAELLSLGCRLERSPLSFLLAGGIGASLGLVLGEDASDKAKLAGVLAGVSILAIPMPAQHTARAEVRLTLRNAGGEVLWQKACLGKVEDRSYVGLTARQDQRLVSRYLTKAVKRCNGCLLGQLRQKLIELASAAE